MAELVREIMIDATPETIWPFLTEPGKHVEWDGTVAEIDPRPGGIYRVLVAGEFQSAGESTSAEPDPIYQGSVTMTTDWTTQAKGTGHYAEVTRSAISQHLSVLKEAALVTERRDGTRRLYRANADTMNDLRTFLDDYWTSGLERLRDVAEASQARKRQTKGSP